MSFYCVYCNQRKSGAKNSHQGKTHEHFIPQSIGGKWTIPICSQCNSFAGSNCDGYLAKVSWLYKFYAQGIIETEGVAVLLDKTEIPARFKFQQKIGSNNINFFYCHHIKTKEKISKKDIRALRVKIETVNSVAGTYQAVLKIALGGIYYLVMKHHKWPLVRSVFQDLTFARWRESFLGKENFNPGGIGKSLGPKIESLSLEESRRILEIRRNPHKRRHIITSEQSEGNLKIIVCLFSEFFWRITIPNAFLIVGKLEEELILHKLTDVNLETAGNFMRINENIFIETVLNDSSLTRGTDKS